jgi:hypothetical protein
VGSIGEKTRGRKSRDTVPLKDGKNTFKIFHGLKNVEKINF